jgi:hypothetical protein
MNVNGTPTMPKRSRHWSAKPLFVGSTTTSASKNSTKTKGRNVCPGPALLNAAATPSPAPFFAAPLPPLNRTLLDS